MSIEIISEDRVVRNAQGVMIGTITEDGKGMLTGPTLYHEGKPVGFIDTEYVDLEYRNRILESMGISRI